MSDNPEMIPDIIKEMRIFQCRNLATGKGDEMKIWKPAIGIIVIGAALFILFGALIAGIDSQNKSDDFVASLCYIEFDGHQYVTCTGWKDCRVLTHSPKCKCKEVANEE